MDEFIKIRVPLIFGIEIISARFSSKNFATCAVYVWFACAQPNIYVYFLDSLLVVAVLLDFTQGIATAGIAYSSLLYVCWRKYCGTFQFEKYCARFWIMKWIVFIFLHIQYTLHTHARAPGKIEEALNNNNNKKNHIDRIDSGP